MRLPEKVPQIGLAVGFAGRRQGAGPGVGDEEQTRIIARQNLRRGCPKGKKVRARQGQVEHLEAVAQQFLQVPRPDVLHSLPVTLEDGVASEDDNHFVRVESLCASDRTCDTVG